MRIYSSKGGPSLVTQSFAMAPSVPSSGSTCYSRNNYFYPEAKSDLNAPPVVVQRLVPFNVYRPGASRRSPQV